MASAKPMRVLANAKDLIEALAQRGALTPAEIAEIIALPRPSVYRLVAGLEAVSLTEMLPDGRINISRRWLSLADASKRGLREWAEADDVLSQISDRSGQTAFLSVPRGDRAVCIAWAQGRGIDVLDLRPGRTLPFHAGAAGRALLAHSAAKAFEEFLSHAPHPALTPLTLTDADALRADAIAIRDRGYAVSDQDVTIGIGALGIPVFDSAKTAIACLSIGGLAADISARTPEFVGILRDGASRLSRN